MHRLILLLLVLLCSYSTVFSQTLHAIIFANTECPGDPRNINDRGIGPSVTCDYYRMKVEMATIASFIGYKLNPKYCVGTQEEFSLKNLNKVIDELTCEPNDIVFFYYSGHGSRNKNDKTLFPQMNLVVDPYHTRIEDSQANYPIYNVKEEIMKKNPRLAIVVGDLCNSIAEWVSPKSIPSDKSATKVDDAPVKFYRDMYLNYKGAVIATSSKPGQSSLAFSDGGAFTLSLMDVMQIMATKGMEASWQLLLDGSIYGTEQRTNERQTPIYDLSDLSFDNSGADNVASTEEQVQSQVEEDADNYTLDEDALSKLLTGIGSESLSLENRIDLSEKVLDILFDTPEAKVEVVGKDGKTIVSTKIAKDYVDWLTMAVNLYKVIPVKGTYNIGNKNKFKQLTVHEMYK